ncbi:unnamed protein product, partial [Allacma fusca]
KQVAFVMTDSGANMVKAFQSLKNTTNELNTVTNSDESDSSSDAESDVEELSNTEDAAILYCEDDSEDDSISEIDIDSSPEITEKLTDIFSETTQHLRCTAHQLQLAINDAMKDTHVAEFLDYINSVIHFFNTNRVYLSKLRDSVGKGLLKKSSTRWNYW